MVVQPYLTQSTIYIDLVLVLSPLNLHFPLEILPEFQCILLFGHDLVAKCTPAHLGLVVFHHVNSNEICALFCDTIRLGFAGLNITMDLFQGVLLGFYFIGGFGFGGRGALLFGGIITGGQGFELGGFFTLRFLSKFLYTALFGYREIRVGRARPDAKTVPIFISVQILTLLYELGGCLLQIFGLGFGVNQGRGCIQ